MKKLSLTICALLAFVLTAAAQEYTYNILHEADTTVKAKISGLSLGSREVKFYRYEYPSKDGRGKAVTISGIIMAPMDVVKGTTPCDGVIMFNHHTIGSPEDAPSAGGLDVPSGMLANPLKPNYIIVMSDYIGYGSSKKEMTEYLTGDTNARNALDGLLAARQLFKDKGIPQGKYLFNVGYSQGGTESMYAAKLRDMEYKDKGITFDKTFVGGGMLDAEAAYKAYVERDRCDDINDVALFLIHMNEVHQLGIKYNELFKGELGKAENVREVMEKKNKDVLSKLGVSQLDSLHQLLQPEYMDLNSDKAKVLIDKLKEIKISKGWNIDKTQKYFIEHSRHDNYVPVQCSRALLNWMAEQEMKPSIVPGKTNLQTNMVVFKLKHQQAAIVWAIQTMAAIQFWPVAYYEGGLNRYYYGVVKDLNLLKLIKFMESLGLDLRKIIKGGAPEYSLHRSASDERIIATLLGVIPKAVETLAKVDLTPEDVAQMLCDSGITVKDIAEATEYLFSSSSPAAAEPAAPSLLTLQEQTEAPAYLLRTYEQTLANWFLMGGLDTDYSSWGW